MVVKKKSIAELERKLKTEREYVQRLLDDWNKAMCTMARMDAELTWLRFFYEEVNLGPAAGDIIDELMLRYEKETGKKVPKIRL